MSPRPSNLARLLESAVGRKHLSVTVARGAIEKTPLLGSQPKWALKVLRRIIDDVRYGIVDSRDLNRSSDIESYFKNLPAGLQPLKTKPSEARPFRDIDIKARAPVTGTTAGTKPRSKPVPRPRKCLAPRRHPFNVPQSTKGEMLLREAGGLDTDRFVLSAAFVLRSFVELAVNDYFELHNISKTAVNKKGTEFQFDMTQRADRVVKHIVAADKSKGPDLRAFRNRFLQPSSQTSIQSLNGFLHNKFQIPTSDELRAGWDSAVPVFVATYGSS